MAASMTLAFTGSVTAFRCPTCLFPLHNTASTVNASTSGRRELFHFSHLPVTRQSPRQQQLDVKAQAAAATAVDLQSLVADAKSSRRTWLEDHALQVLRDAVEKFEHPVFPCALIAGDVVVLDLLARLGYLQNGKVKVVFVDTFHLFPETHGFLHQLEEKHGFKALEYHAKGFEDKAAYKKVHGSDLYIVDIDEYDRICKVEPFNRALKELHADVMINGRRQDHGAERAHVEVFEAGQPVKCQPLAWWTFRDCFDYLETNKLQYHPLHDQGYPSVGDVHSTLPVPKEKWFEYGGERSGRFQGLSNKDGAAKTECGIHSQI